MRCIRAFIVLGLATAASAQEPVYSLRPGSVMDRESCLPPCACPYVHSNGPMTGTFSLSFLDSNPLFTRYRLTGIQWVADLGQGSTPMSGIGIYTIGGDFALVHRLELALTIGPLTVLTEFDSGFVPVDTQHPFPEFAITTTAEPVCRRDTIRVIVAPNLATCYPNCDASTTAPILNVGDFQCFLNRYAAADPYANCDHSTVAPTLNVADFICFINTYAAGCP